MTNKRGILLRRNDKKRMTKRGKKTCGIDYGDSSYVGMTKKGRIKKDNKQKNSITGEEIRSRSCHSDAGGIALEHYLSL